MNLTVQIDYATYPSPFGDFIRSCSVTQSRACVWIQVGIHCNKQTRRNSVSSETRHGRNTIAKAKASNTQDIQRGRKRKN